MWPLCISCDRLTHRINDQFCLRHKVKDDAMNDMRRELLQDQIADKLGLASDAPLVELRDEQ